MSQEQVKRIDMLIDELSHDEVSGAALALANKIAENNIPVRLIILGHKIAIPCALNDKVEVKFLGISRDSKFIANILYFIRIYFILSVYLARSGCYKLFVWGTELTAMAEFMRLTLPLIYKIIGVGGDGISRHLQNDRNSITRSFLNWIYKTLLHKLEFIIAQSYDMHDVLQSVYSIPEGKIAVIYPLLQEKFFHTPLQKSKTGKILFVGGLIEDKGVFHILEILLNLNNKNATLQFFGGVEHDNLLMEKIREFGLQGRISFISGQSDILPYLQSADALIVTSKYQGFCIELVQSIACGVPAVAFDCVSGSTEIIKNGVNGYVIPKGDVMLFAKKLDEILACNWDAVAISETARKFHPDEAIKRYLQVIRRIFV